MKERKRRKFDTKIAVVSIKWKLFGILYKGNKYTINRKPRGSVSEEKATCDVEEVERGNREDKQGKAVNGD